MVQSVRFAFIGMVSALAVAGAAKSALSKPAAPAKRVEVAFVLDTTGSMESLIDGAKRKIWSIANSIIDINPNADVRMALIGYRDLGDDYVVRSYQMSADIQGLYGNLLQFVADGGGDGPESVNEALDAAVKDLEWSKDDGTRRIIFLVGDAPPHMDYANAPRYPSVLAKARDKAIIVNTVQAGDEPETAEYWRDIARLGKGKYFAIPQDGGQVEVINSPYDDEIIVLQQKIDRTVVPYGTYEKQQEVRAKMETKGAAPAAVQVDNSKFYSKRSASKEIVTGGGDLLDDVRNNVRKLEDISEDELPADLKGKSAGDLKAAVTERTAARVKLEGEMAELIKKRDAYVAAQTAKTAGADQDSFDKKIKAGIAEQF